MSPVNQLRPLLVGVDTGGTFTDCIFLRGSSMEVIKVASVPDEIADAAVDVLKSLLKSGQFSQLHVLHGTTVGTNALLEGKGARVALITTAGFEDLLEIGRQNRPRLYDLNVTRRPPLVPAELRWGVRERTLHDGSILIPLASSQFPRFSQKLRRDRVESLAVCLLFSYANPKHEQAIARQLRRTGLPVSVSHELLPEFREYERLSTTVINASLAPLMSRYLASVDGKLRRQLRPTPVKLQVMQSSGGIMTARQAAQQPVRTILSGPAGGVVATEWLARQMKLDQVISFDMGGTSTDVCLINGAATITHETMLAEQPVAIPVLDVHTVGAGGGSRARIDAGRALRVGPHSAGAAPGPACYGRGGTEPTVTDAHAALGRLDPAAFLGGAFPLQLGAAERCLDDFLRRHRGAWKSREHLAESILRVCNSTMEQALRLISVERGHDPRDYSLVCFGGAGGLHAAELARALELKRVIVPSNPGAFSALGVLISDIVSDTSQSVLLRCPAEGSPEYGLFRRALDLRFQALETASRQALRRAGQDEPLALCERSIAVRYAGQSFELQIPISTRFAAFFHQVHERAYGYADPARTLEVVSIKVRLRIPTAKPRLLRRRATGGGDISKPVQRYQPSWFAGRLVRTAFLQRRRLRAGMSFAGPAVVTEYSSTTVVPPGFVCRVDEFLNLVIEELGKSRANIGWGIHEKPGRGGA